VTTQELWLAECPFMDQGLIRPLISTGGQVVLMCDEDGTVWLRPEDITSDRHFQPTVPEWEAAEGIRVVPGTTRWATREDLNAPPWNAISWHDLGASG
jgi:hypothetical protein